MTPLRGLGFPRLSNRPPEFSVKVAPTSDSVNIVVGKQANFVVGAEMNAFFARKVAAAKVAGVPAVHLNCFNPAFLEHDHGKLLDGTRRAAFKAAFKVPVHVPLSGKTMAFDGGGNCVEGC